MAYITDADLAAMGVEIPPAKAIAMIEDAVAQAILVAPCLTNDDDLDDNQKAAVKAVLRGAILRWNEAGTGALQRETAGPFGYEVDTRQQRRSLYWPSEIEQLQAICTRVSGTSGLVFSLATTRGDIETPSVDDPFDREDW